MTEFKHYVYDHDPDKFDHYIIMSNGATFVIRLGTPSQQHIPNYRGYRALSALEVDESGKAYLLPATGTDSVKYYPTLAEAKETLQKYADNRAKIHAWTRVE